MTVAATTREQRLELLLHSDLELEGRIVSASNLTCRVRLGGDAFAVYKPVSGTRPLYDFDARSLAAREVAAYLVSAAGGWDVVPETVLRDGPLGLGSVQWWIEPEAPPGEGLVDVVRAQQLPVDWLAVVQAEDEEGSPVVVAHADRADLRGLAVLDVLLNNADRKAAHLLLDADDRLWGVDHGLCLHAQEKLRTVLWGWHGCPVPEEELERARRLRGELARDRPLAGALGQLVSAREVEALRARVTGLLGLQVLPHPPLSRYPLPWPLW